jgi:hypothetical protein
MVLPNVIASSTTFNQSSIASYSWPVTVSGGVYLSFDSNLIFLANNNYFIIGGANSTIDGLGYSIDVSGVSDYPGLIRNGTNSTNGKSNIVVKNIGVKSSHGSNLIVNGGWIGQTYYSNNVSGNIVQNCYYSGRVSNNSGGIVGSYSASGTNGNLLIKSCYGLPSSDIDDSAGGIVGSFAANSNGTLTVSNCYTTSTMAGDKAGGIIGSNSANSGGTVNVYNSYTTGFIFSAFGGGIVGAYVANNGTVNVYNSYTRGGQRYGSGGIFGAYVAENNGVVRVDNCYTTGGVSGGSTAGIFGSSAGNANILASNCYITNISNSISSIDSYGNNRPGVSNSVLSKLDQSNCYIEFSPSTDPVVWNNAHANTALTGVGSTWYVPLATNTPYLLATPVSFISFSVPTKNYGNAPFTITQPITNISGGVFTYTSSDSSVATIWGSTITIVGAGTTTIRATQTGPDQYSGVMDVSFVVNKIDPTFTTTFTAPTKTYGDASFSLVPPTSSSPASFSYTIDNPNVGTIVGNRVLIVGAGSSTIRATQASNSNYNSKFVDASFIVNKAVPIIGGLSDITRYFLDPSFILQNPSSNSPGFFSYTIDNSNVATLSGLHNEVVVNKSIGTATITATQASTDNYTASSPTSATLNILRQSQITTDVRLIQDGLQYISWPVSIGNGSTPITITLGENLIFTDSEKYFTITGESVVIDGQNKTIDISGVSNYPGVVNNTGFNNTVIKDLKVYSNGTLAPGAGWIGQEWYGENATGLKCTNCRSTGIIGENCGGIFGQNLANGNARIDISYCSSTGDINGQYAGGIVGPYSNNFSLYQCYSTGEINGSNSGGSVGYHSGPNIHTYLSYSKGEVNGFKSRGFYAFTVQEL